MKDLSGDYLESILDGCAGRVGYFQPNEGVFVPKAWRVIVELEADWAKKAYNLDFHKVSGSLRRMGYKEQPHWPPSFRGFWKKREGGIYVFNPEEGGLVWGLYNLQEM